jgi:hypothetical protein
VLLPCCPQLIFCCHLSPNDHFTLLTNIFEIFSRDHYSCSFYLLPVKLNSHPITLGLRKIYQILLLTHFIISTFHLPFFNIVLSSFFLQRIQVCSYFTLLSSSYITTSFTFLLRIFCLLQERFSTQINFRFRFLYLPLFYQIFVRYFCTLYSY